MRRSLVAGDAVCLLVAGLVALSLGWADSGPLGTGGAGRATVLVVAGLALLQHQHLYRSARSSVVTLEVVALLHVAGGLVLANVVLDQLSGLDPRWARGVVVSAVAFFLLVIWRSVYRGYLRSARSNGHFLRPVVIVGADCEAARLYRLLDDHADSGYRCLGVTGDREDALANGLAAVWLGPAERAVEMVEDGASTGVILVSSALKATTTNDIARQVQRRGGHVHLSSALSSFDHRRIALQPIAHEPLLYVQPAGSAGGRRSAVAKRALDIVGACIGLTLTAPFLLVAAVAIRRSGGPVLFRQERVGKDGKPFTMLKLRTMVEEAESMVVDLVDHNDREGPLFKLEEDPRITPIGRVLRATDLDEIPQLINVLRGEMSLVGPRPALPSEVEQFDAELRRRTDVLPGLTGLWQVESRDHPSFDAYQRLDLFYVDNGSLMLDLVILLLTFESKVVQRLRLRPRRRVAAAGAGPAVLPRLEDLPGTAAS